MPTYEYECTGCGFRFEVFQKISDPPKESCPKCGKVVKRLIGKGAGIIFSRNLLLLKNNLGIPMQHFISDYIGKGGGFLRHRLP